MAKSYKDEPLLKEWYMDDHLGNKNAIHVELRDASERVEQDRTVFSNSLAGHLKAFVPFIANDEDHFPDYIHEAKRHWIYEKKGSIISLLEVAGHGWKFEVYPFDDCVELTNDPYDSSIERYQTEEEAHKAVIKLMEQIE